MIMSKKTTIFIFVFAIFFLFLSINNIYAQTSANDAVGVSLTIIDAPAQASGSVPLYILQPPKKEPFIPPVDNPSELKAIVKVEGVDLSWSNPESEDFSYIRLVRNEDRFHSDPFLGKLIYEGKGESILDRDVIPDKEYFYTLFNRNDDGNFSSGSAVSVKTFVFVKKPITIETPIQPEVKSKDIAPVYRVRQLKQKVQPLNEKEVVMVNSIQNIIVDTDEVAEDGDYLKIIGPNGETLGQHIFSFNENSGRYESVIPPLKIEGIYNITIYRYNNNNPEVLSKGSLSVLNIIEETKKEDTCKGIGCNIIEYIKYAFVLTILFLIFKITI